MQLTIMVVQIIFPVILQTLINFRMLFIGRPKTGVTLVRK